MNNILIRIAPFYHNLCSIDCSELPGSSCSKVVLGAAVFHIQNAQVIQERLYIASVTTLAIFSPIPIASILWDHYDGTVYILPNCNSFCSFKSTCEIMRINLNNSRGVSGSGSKRKYLGSRHHSSYLNDIFLRITFDKARYLASVAVLCFTAIGLISFALL